MLAFQTGDILRLTETYSESLSDGQSHPVTVIQEVEVLGVDGNRIYLKPQFLKPDAQAWLECLPGSAVRTSHASSK